MTSSTKTTMLFFPALLLFFSCGAGLIVRSSAEWDRTDWYGKKVIVLPGLGAAGIRFSDPNPNESVHKHLTAQLPRLPRYRKGLVAFYPEVSREFTARDYWPLFRKIKEIFTTTGQVDTLLLGDLGNKMQTEYIIVPLFLSTEYTTWEFTGVFSYYGAAVELALYSVKEKEIVFRARARGYSLGDLEKAFLGASEEVVKVFK